MDIVIISNFHSDYSITDNDRFLYLANLLVNNNEVEIVTSDFCHEKKEHMDRPVGKWPFKITFLHELGYPKNICLKRFVSHFIWGLNVKKYIKKRKKPDVIYCAVPSLTGPFFVSKFCKKNNVRFIIDIQDLWPEAFRLILNIPIVCDLFFLPWTIMARTIYKTADTIIAVSNTYAERGALDNKKNAEHYSVFLGTDLDKFDINRTMQLNLKKDKLWLGYCGTLGSSYDLTCVIDALEIVNQETENVPQFIIMGDGPLEEKFKSYAQKKGVDCLFVGRIPYDKMCAMLSQCDFVVNPIMPGAAQSIINKHADYVASGLPILSTQDSPEFKQLVVEYEMGFNCNNEDANDLARHILMLIQNPTLRKQMGQNARRCAEEKFDRKEIYKRIIQKIENN